MKQGYKISGGDQNGAIVTTYDQNAAAEKTYTRDEMMFIAGYAYGFDGSTPLDEIKRLVSEQIDKIK